MPHGFCLGVVQAVRRAEEALAEGPLFCLHPPIHNESVCEALAAKGLRNHEIAEKLFISENTVKRHLKSAFQKLNIDRRSRLVEMLR